MNNYKCECDIQDEKGRRTETVFVKNCNSEEDAEYVCKYNFIIEKCVIFYGAKISKI